MATNPLAVAQALGAQRHEECQGLMLCEECAAAYVGVGVLPFQQAVCTVIPPIQIEPAALASAALAWIRLGRRQRFTQHELHRAIAKNGKKGAGKEIGEVIRLLQGTRHIDAAPAELDHPGRPSKAFFVNPKLHGVQHAG
jgi:hypothetical protein